MEATSTAIIGPANGSHLVRIAGFEPRIDSEAGIVTQWAFQLEAAEPIQDNQQPPGTIAEGTRLGTFSVFMAPSQYRTQDACQKSAKAYSQALNNIPRDMKVDPGFRKADAAWAALPAQQKRPTFTGTPPIMDSELEWYSQWVGTVVIATFSGKNGMVNLSSMSAKDGPRAARKGART